MPIYIRSEGYPDKLAVLKLCELTGVPTDPRYAQYMRGHVRLDAALPKCNEAASRGTPFIVIRDLDQYECPPALIADKLPILAILLSLHIPVRTIEAWLLADRQQFAKFLGVSRDRLPVHPEQEVSPKQTVIQLARHSQRREIREQIVPIDQTTREGPEYSSVLGEFILGHWSPLEAATRSPSLDRSIKRLKSFAGLIRGI